MGRNETTIEGIEGGRAAFAYRCAVEGKNIINGDQIGGIHYKDDKYKSYIKKMLTMIYNNGLGPTLAFVVSKKTGQEKDRKPGMVENPQKAYDLIYWQLGQWLSMDPKKILPLGNDEDLVLAVVSLKSKRYKYVTRELVSLLSWVKRFSEGLILEDDME